MNDNVRTKLELLENGPSMPRKQSKKRKRLKKVESEQELKVSSNVEAIPVEEQNVVFKPNDGPQTEFLASPEGSKGLAAPTFEHPLKEVNQNQIVKNFGEFTPDEVSVEDLGNNNSMAIRMMKEAGWD